MFRGITDLGLHAHTGRLVWVEHPRKNSVLFVKLLEQLRSHYRQRRGGRSDPPHGAFARSIGRPVIQRRGAGAPGSAAFAVGRVRRWTRS